MVGRVGIEVGVSGVKSGHAPMTFGLSTLVLDTGVSK